MYSTNKVNQWTDQGTTELDIRYILKDKAAFMDGEQ